MAVAPTEIRTLARSYTKAAINTLVGIMRQPKAPPAARVMAANALLDRGWGKAAHLVEVDGEHIVLRNNLPMPLAFRRIQCGAGSSGASVRPAQLARCCD